MSYLRRRNGYGYICEKVKNGETGEWEERTIHSFGKITSKEQEEEWEWIAKTGEEQILDEKECADFAEEMEEEIQELQKKYPKRKILIKSVWEYPESQEAWEEEIEDRESGEERQYIAYTNGFFLESDRAAGKIYLSIIMVRGSSPKASC